MSNSENASTRSIAIFKVGVAALSAVLFVLSFSNSISLWSLQSWQILAWPIRLLLVLLIIASVVPRISTSVGEYLSKYLGSTRSPKANRAFILAASILLVGLALLHSENHLLGDGYNVMGNIHDAEFASPTEPLSYILHAGLAAIFTGSSNNVVLAFRVSSFVAGLILFAFLFTWMRDRRNGLLLLAALLGFAVMQFFAGYIENYTYSFLFSLLYLARACRDLEQSRLRITTLLLLVIAVAFHLSAVVLLPAVAYHLYSILKGKWARILILLLTALSGLLGIVFIVKSSFLAHAFVPLAPTPENLYYLMSASHLLDLLNIVIRVYPLLPIVLLLPVVWNLPHRNFIGLALIFSFLFTALVDPRIGAFRDWDLLSITSAPAIVLTLLTIERCAELNRKTIYQLLLPLVLFGLLHTGSWIWSNSDRDYSYKSVLALVKQDPHYRTNYFGGTRMLSWHSLALNRYQDPEEALRSGELYLTAHPEDYRNLFGFAYLKHKLGKFQEAAQMVSGKWQYFPPELQVFQIVSGIFHDAGRFDDEREALTAGLKAFPNDGWLTNCLNQLDSKSLEAPPKN